MNYELAKKLKDAGFPQIAVERTGVFTSILDENFMVVEPLLEQLIEACGKSFTGLSHKNPLIKNWSYAKIKWIARADKNRDKFYITFGKTPEEAVANLWLELNKSTPKNK